VMIMDEIKELDIIWYDFKDAEGGQWEIRNKINELVKAYNRLYHLVKGVTNDWWGYNKEMDSGWFTGVV